MDIEWVTPPYVHREKSTDWYWWLGFVCIALVVISVLLKNYLFAVIVIIGGFVIGMIASREPDDLVYRVTRRGLIAGERLFPYTSLDSFFIRGHDLHERPRLLIRSRSILSPLIVIPLPGVNLEALRELLLQYLPEEELNESPIDVIADRLGF